MKTLPLMMMIAALPLVAQAQIADFASVIVNAEELQPSTRIEAAFPQPMVAEDQAGRAAGSAIVDVTPTWKGTWVWESPRVARWQPAEPAKFATKYRFTVKSRLKDLAGRTVSTGPATAITTPEFGMTRNSAVRLEGISDIRQSPRLLVFNGPVSLASARGLAFISDEGMRVTAVTRTAVFSELDRSSQFRLPWSEAVVAGTEYRNFDEDDGEGGGGRPAADAAMPHALVVAPAEPLPVGTNWKITGIGTLASAADSKTLASDVDPVVWGTVEPGVVLRLESESGVNLPNTLRLDFDKPVASGRDDYARWIFVEDLAGATEFEIHGRSLYVRNEKLRFNRSYSVSVAAGLPMADGLELSQAFSGSARFQPEPGGILLPSSDEILLLHGTGRYNLQHVNLSSLRVRVREIDAENEALVRQAYAAYRPDFETTRAGTRIGMPVTYSLIPGKELLNEVHNTHDPGATNRLRPLALNLPGLLGEKPRPATLFLQVEGHSSRGVDTPVDVIAQAVVQISDLGFAWKSSQSAREAVIFVFSHQTGLPVAGATVRGHSGGGEVLAEAESDASGLARLVFPGEPEKRHPAAITLAKGGDRNHFGGFTLSSMGLSPWRMGVSNFSWEAAPDNNIASSVFCDRPLYRPGETAHVAAFVRRFRKNLPQIDDTLKATLVLHDPRSREVARVEVKPDEHGMIAHDFVLPHEPAGHYRAELRVRGTDGKENHRGYLFFLVQEFSRNAFEVALPLPSELVAPAAIESTVAAAYLQGAPVNGGDTRWTAWFQSRGFYPDTFRDYLFGDHRREDWNYWYHYFGRGFEDGSGSRRAVQSGETVLDASGQASIAIPVPPDPDFPSPRTASVFAEVTDGRQQTLAARGEVLIHPADFYIGVARPPTLIRENSKLALDVIAVDTAGKQTDASRELSWKLEKREWTSVEIAQAGGGTSIRNEETMRLVAEAAVVLNGGRGRVEATPGDAGEYFLTLDGADDAGRPVRTTVGFTVYGSGNDSWVTARQGVLDVLPDKRGYRAGDTARLLVKSPITGTALVTVERDSVERSFIAKIDGEGSVIELPIVELDAPNIHVGVLLIQGGEGSGLAHPMPRVRAGYVSLNVEHRIAALDVAVTPGRPSVLPGDHAHVEITVKDSHGRPASGSRVVFYAVDEGSLAVTGYDNPDLAAAFHPQRPLRVMSGTSLSQLLAEDPEARYYGNKGYVIGGGGEEGMSARATRRDFQPCAAWQADLVTNAQGKCVLSFKTPDTLTRYRMIAVVAAPDGWRFGTGIGALEVSKPLMIEPATPRFAHFGDIARVRAQVFNQTASAGRFAATLTPDSHAIIDGPSVVEIDLGPGENGPVEFVVRFTEPGNTTWRWDVEPRSWERPPADFEAEDLADSMESSFEVHHPIPLLRENHVFTLHPGSALKPLENADPLLLAGEGAVTVRVSNTRLLDALEASRFLRRYPYGCAEQTTSALVPWVASHALRRIMPDAPDEAETAKAMEMGCRRLASMLTPEGGLAYWPGGDDPVLWSTVHAAHVLVQARDNGLKVPESLLDPMLEYLAGQLRGMIEQDIAAVRPERVRALYVLALAGNADTAYHNKLVASKEKLSRDSLLYLALALAAADPDDDAIPAVITAAANAKAADTWFPSSQLQALRVAAVTAANLPRAQADAELDKLLAMRDSSGHWGTTFSNSWSLLALARYHQKFEANFGTATPVLAWPGDRKELPLPPHAAQSSLDIGLADLKGGAPLEISLAEGDSPVYISVTIAARPVEMPPKAAVPGLAINRRYLRVAPDGSLEPAESFTVGDLIAVELTLDHKGDLLYLVVDDPLPACLEAIHPDFVSRTGQDAAGLVPGNWVTSHSELRDERAVFFCDRLWNPGQSRLHYLARVIRAGDFFAPPTLAEAMYDPTTRALGEGGRITSTPRSR